MRKPVAAAPDRLDQRTRVLVLVGALGIGGAEMDILRVMPRLDRSHFDVRVYCFDEPGALAARVESAGVPVVLSRRARKAASHGHAMSASLPSRIVRQGSRLVASAIELRRYLAAERIDIVHAFLPYAYIVGGLATAALPRCRLVMSRLSSNFYMEKFPHYRLVETRLLHRRVDAVICNADSIRAELADEGVPADRITIIPNGIDVDAFAGSPDRRLKARTALGIAADALVMTCVANLHPYKGHDDLVAALVQVRSKLPGSWLLLCAGRDVDGHRQKLEAEARAQGLADHVRFLGEVEEIPQLLAASDIHIHPSREDAFPNSVLEAMAAGLPVVATAVGAVPEMLAGSGSEVCAPKAPAALANLIAFLASDAVQRQTLGVANAGRARTLYGIDAVARAYQRTYRKTIRPS